jgi:GTP-binding protein
LTAVEEADVLLFIVDAMEGVMPSDLDAADVLRRSGKPIVLAANKIDSPRHSGEALQFHKLGLGDPVPISAYHNLGIGDLMDKVINSLPAPSAPEFTELEGMKLAIVGHPNVGKSMLLNTILGEERVIVDEIPGTTRDAIDTIFRYDGKNVVLIDTAGIRRRGRVSQGIERYSVVRALNAIERADVALLVIDATEGITAQDTHILGYIQQSYDSVILLVNKWDLIEEKDVRQYTKHIKLRLRFMPYIPILFISAKTGQRVDKIVPTAEKVYDERFKRVSTSLLNEILGEAVAAHAPGTKGGNKLQFLYATQAEVNPPTFIFFVNDAELIHFSYRRYLENKIRRVLGFKGTPLRFIFRSRGARR